MFWLLFLSVKAWTMCIISWHYYGFYIMVNWIHIMFYISILVAVICHSFEREELMFVYVYTNGMYKYFLFFCTLHIYMSISEICNQIQLVFISIFYLYYVLLYLFIWEYFLSYSLILFLLSISCLSLLLSLLFAHCLIPRCRAKLNFSCRAPIKVHLILTHLIFI